MATEVASSRLAVGLAHPHAAEPLGRDRQPLRSECACLHALARTRSVSARKARASSSSRSLASSSPIETRQPSPANGRTTMPSSSAAAANSAVRLAEREPDEVALRLGHVPARLAQPGADPVPLGDQRVHPLEQRRPRRPATRWRRPGRRRRRRTAATPRAARRRSAPARRRTRPGSRPARRPWRRCGTAPRSGARGRSRARRPRRPSARTRRRPRRPRPARPRAPRARKASSSVWVTAGPVGLLGVQTMTHPGARRDRGGHRVEVVPPVRGDRHRHRGRGGGGDRDRVGLERAPRVDDLVAGLAERGEQLVDQRDRPGRRRPGRRPAPASRAASASYSAVLPMSG